MLETIRKYWIGLLLLVMIGIHASIVGLIRYQASLAKLDASCEVDLGNYLGYQSSRQAPLSMRIHAIVPASQRLKSRQLLELNRFQIRQAMEERLRQIDSEILTDPYLTDLKSQLLDVLVQITGGTAVEEIVITDVFEPKDMASLVFQSHGSLKTPRPVVSSLRAHHTSDASDGLTSDDLTGVQDHSDRSDHRSDHHE